MKKVKALKTAHTSNSKMGMGDYYGSAIRNPIGRVRDGWGMNETPKKKLRIPPKSLA